MTCQPDSPLKHKHHIVPRYRGGSDDPSNLVEVSVVQHAMWHFCNYQLWGEPEDRLAWRGLSGAIGKEEVLRERMRIGGYKAAKKAKEKYNSPDYRRRNAEHLKGIQRKGSEASRSPEAIAKKKETMRRMSHQKGEKNSQYGTRWIHNMELKVSKRIDKGDLLPEGWSEGRVIDFDKKLNPVKRVRRKAVKERLGTPRDWYHRDYGYVLDVTSSELCEMYKDQKLDKGALSQVSLGRNSHHKGWCMATNIVDLTPKRDIKMNWEHDAYGVVFGVSVNEMIDKYKDQGLTDYGLFKVINGDTKSHKGWKLRKD